MYIAIGIILLAAALFLIVAVLLQTGKSQGLSGTISGGSETFFGKNKGKSRDKKLATITIIVAVVFVLIVLGVFISQDYTSIWGTATNVTTTTTTEIRARATEVAQSPKDVISSAGIVRNLTTILMIVGLL